jgi:hypothetical protein
MRPIQNLLAAAVAIAGLPFTALPFSAEAATLGAADYATQYEYREFYSATDNKPFRIVLLGNPFPNMEIGEVGRRMLPVMQASKPPPRLTFTYDVPAEPPHPDYRMMLVFDAVSNLTAAEVCRGGTSFRSGTPGTPGRVTLFAVYCRNDQFLSQVIANTNATSPDDPAMAALFRELFGVLFSRNPSLMPQTGGTPFR